METHSVDVRVRFRINDQPIYGMGISKLLQRTDELGSINAASKEIGMTYRKALQIIKNAEEAFGEPILLKKTGGASGGGSGLTEFGKGLVYQFKVLEDDVLQYTLEKTKEYFPHFLDNES